MAAEKTKKKTDPDEKQTENTTPADGVNHATADENNDSSETDSQKQVKTEITDPIKNLEEELESARGEAQQSYDRFLRVSAEFDNFKKRSQRDMAEFRKFANQSFAKSLLPIVDNLERAIGSSKENNTSDTCLVDGIGLTLQELLKVFEQFGIKPIESVGEPFDPVYHQAVMQEETDQQPENTVISELQKGYLLHDRLLRPSMVSVATSGKQESKKNEGENNNTTNNE